MTLLRVDARLLAPTWHALLMHETGLRRVLLPLALLLVTGALVACDSEAPDPPEADGFVYAALGDSYSAAPGLPKVIDRNCERSDHNYAHLVAREIPGAVLTDVTCGGASSEGVLQSHTQTAKGVVQRPQIEAVTPDTDLVTFGFGANDAGFVVAAAADCLLFARFDPEGAPCREANAKRVRGIVRQVRANLVEALQAVIRQAPDAQVLVIGYPVLFESERGCPRRFPIARGDVRFVQDSYSRLNEAVAAAAAEVGAEFVDVAAASKGHDLCSDDPWINGQHEDDETGAAEYHPQPAMQRGIAQLVRDLI